MKKTRTGVIITKKELNEITNNPERFDEFIKTLETLDEEKSVEDLLSEIEELEEKIEDLELNLLSSELEVDLLQNQIDELEIEISTRKPTEAIEVWKDELWEKVRDKYTLQELETLLNRE